VPLCLDGQKGRIAYRFVMYVGKKCTRRFLMFDSDFTLGQANRDN